MPQGIQAGREEHKWPEFWTGAAATTLCTTRGCPAVCTPFFVCFISEASTVECVMANGNLGAQICGPHSWHATFLLSKATINAFELLRGKKTQRDEICTSAKQSYGALLLTFSSRKLTSSLMCQSRLFVFEISYQMTVCKTVCVCICAHVCVALLKHCLHLIYIVTSSFYGSRWYGSHKSRIIRSTFKKKCT